MFSDYGNWETAISGSSEPRAHAMFCLLPVLDAQPEVQTRRDSKTPLYLL